MSGLRDITTDEAIAWCLDPRNDNYGGSGKDIVHVMADNYDPNGEEGEQDGLTPDDVATWMVAVWERGGGIEVDSEGFGEWGPFFLLWEGDTEPTQPRPWTPDESLSRLESLVTAVYAGPFGGDPTPRIALDTLHAFIKQVNEHGSTDLEWGEAGDCYDRIIDDKDVALAVGFEHAYSTKFGDWLQETEYADIKAKAKELGVGRHYGLPHCIWCLQAD